MRKQYFALVLVFVLFHVSFGQIQVFFEDFQSGVIPPDFTVINVNGQKILFTSNLLSNNESTQKRMISIKIEGIFEPEQVRIQKSIDKEDFGRKGLFRADSIIFYQYDGT